MPPREVFTLAHHDRDGKFDSAQFQSQRNSSIPIREANESSYISSPAYLPQDMQALSDSSFKAQAPSPFFARQRSDSKSSLPLSYSDSLPQDSQSIPGPPAQNPYIVPLQSDHDLRSPSSLTQHLPLSIDTSAPTRSLSTKTELPAYSSPILDNKNHNMQNNAGYSNNHSMNAMRSAPARGYSSPAPAPYGGQQFESMPPTAPPMQSMQSMQNVQSMPPMPNMPMQTMQPTAGPTMSADPARNVKNIPYNANGERGWSNGCCSFTGACGTCLLGLFVPCIPYAQNKSRLSHLERHRAPHPDGGEMCNSDCFIHGSLTFCCAIGWVMQIGNRGSIRSRYRIAGNGCTDCLMAGFCGPCELAQEAQELELEERALMNNSQYPPSGNASTIMYAKEY